MQAALARLMHGRTTIIVAHRLSTVRDADRIVVLEGARIAEQGRHDELMERRGTYHRLVEHQLVIGDQQVALATRRGGAIWSWSTSRGVRESAQQ